MSDNPLVLAGLIALVSYFGWQWLGDLKAWRAGSPNRGALPGATAAPARATLIAVAGALAILALEVAGEYALGIVGEQSTMRALFAVYTLFAAFMEELIFRGFLWDWVREKARGMSPWLAVVALSALFALLHPFLWDWKDGTLALQFTTKAWFSTGITFLSSLWFFVCRVAPWNPQQSLIPSVAGHAARNLGVIVIKAAQGFLAL